MKIKILLSLFLFISLSSVNSYASEDLSTFTKVGKLIDRLLNGECDQKDENSVYRCSNEKGLYFKWKNKDGEWKTSKKYPY